MPAAPSLGQLATRATRAEQRNPLRLARCLRSPWVDRFPLSSAAMDADAPQSGGGGPVQNLQGIQMPLLSREAGRVCGMTAVPIAPQAHSLCLRTPLLLYSHYIDPSRPTCTLQRSLLYILWHQPGQSKKGGRRCASGRERGGGTGRGGDRKRKRFEGSAPLRRPTGSHVSECGFFFKSTKRGQRRRRGFCRGQNNSVSTPCAVRAPRN